MSESKHTPAPWVGFVDRGQLVAIMPAGRPGDVCQFAVPPTDADGNLMLAAPNLLKALIAMVDAYGIPDNKGREAPIIKNARAAIAKATGEPRP